MRWRGERQSSNIEDRRGMSAGKVAVGGGLGTVLLLIVALIFGADPRRLLEQLPSEPSSEEALNAASSIGDDKIQRQQTGYVVPDSFTHGSSEQRLRWFKRGYDTGDIRQGDTFSAPQL